MAEDIGTRNVPKKDELLGDIRRELEQPAAPQSVPQKKRKYDPYAQNSTIDDTGLMAKLDDLETLLVSKQSAGRPPKPVAAKSAAATNPNQLNHLDYP